MTPGRASDVLFVLAVLVLVVALLQASGWLYLLAAVLLVPAVALTVAKRRAGRRARG